MNDSSVILVPLDGSVAAESALPYAETLAHTLAATLCLLLVVPSTPAAGSNGLGRLPEQLSPPEAEQTLAATATELRARGVPVVTAVERGDPAERILAAAKRPDVKLVVTATHGRGGLERLVIGSVADKVMRRCTRPTLLVKADTLAPLQAPMELKRVMVPLDGSALAEAALPLAVRLAEAGGARLALVQALTPVVESLPPGAYIPDLGEWEAEAEAVAKRYLERVRSRLPAGVDAVTVVLHGLGPGTLLVEFARSSEVDLVVMSTHGYGGLQRLAIGSKADLLVRSGVPALLVRPPTTPGLLGQAIGSEPKMSPVGRHES